MPITTFEKACQDAYTAGYEAGFAARDRLHKQFRKGRLWEYRLAVKLVKESIRQAKSKY